MNFSLLNAIIDHQFDVVPNIISYLHPCDIASLICVSKKYYRLFYDFDKVLPWAFQRFQNTILLKNLFYRLKWLVESSSSLERDDSEEIIMIFQQLIMKLSHFDDNVIVNIHAEFIYGHQTILLYHCPSVLTFRSLGWMKNEVWQNAVLYLFDYLYDFERTLKKADDPRSFFQLSRDLNIAYPSFRYDEIAKNIRCYFPKFYFHAYNETYTLSLKRFNNMTRMIKFMNRSDLIFRKTFCNLYRFVIDVLQLNKRKNGIYLSVPEVQIIDHNLCADHSTEMLNGQCWFRMELYKDSNVLIVYVPSIKKYEMSSMNVISRWYVGAVISEDYVWLTNMLVPEVHQFLQDLEKDPVTVFSKQGKPQFCWVCNRGIRKRSRNGQWLSDVCANRVWKYQMKSRKRQRRCNENS